MPDQIYIQEVDFLITMDGHPWLMVEAKINDPEPHPPIARYQSILRIPAVQVVNRRGVQRLIKANPGSTLIIDAAAWLARLG